MAMRPRQLIWFDALAGATVGVLVLTLRDWLTGLFALPAQLVLTMGVANLAYGCVSFGLASLTKGERVPFLRVVAAANVLWASYCVVLAVLWWGKASVFGLGQLAGEALFVGSLGVIEWRAAGLRR